MNVRDNDKITQKIFQKGMEIEEMRKELERKLKDLETIYELQRRAQECSKMIA